MGECLGYIARALKVPAPYIAWAVVTVFLSVSGPFGTYIGFPPLSRVFFWAIVIGCGIVLGLAIRVCLQVRFRDMPYWPAALAAVLTVSTLLAWPIRHFATFLSGGSDSLVPSTPEIFLIIATIGVAIAALRAVMEGRGPIDPPAVAMPDEAPLPRLLERVDPETRGPLLRVSARDHYLIVSTDNGTAELLLRFSDALAELDGVDGMQVHRSHWVAASAVVTSEREKGRTFLVLRDGTRVPVSRNYQKQVEERGFL